MSRKKEIRLLCAEADREALKPIVEQLNAKGFTVSDAKDAKKDDIVLAALSAAFYADAEKTESLFGLIGKGAENVLPLQMDGTQIPDTVKTRCMPGTSSLQRGATPRRSRNGSPGRCLPRCPFFRRS